MLNFYPILATWRKLSDCKEKCERKLISTLLFATLQYFEIPTGKSDEFLGSIGCYHLVTCQKWLETFVNGSLEDFAMENRGGKHVSTFYEGFPELEMAAKIFATQKCQQKPAELKLSDLAQFIDSKFYELTGQTKDPTAGVIRSESMGTKCKIGHLEYTDENGDLQLIPCHFENDPNVGKTKGLLELAKDLNVNVPAGCLLPQLRDLLSQHPAFKT
ncbi:unnamed protein product, partial [Didymodactylos carnosus]